LPLLAAGLLGCTIGDIAEAAEPGVLFGLSGFTSGELGSPGIQITGTGFSSLNLSTSVETAVGGNGQTFLSTASALDPATRMLYIQVVQSDGVHLVAVDSATGGIRSIARLPNPLQTMVFDPLTGLLFGLSGFSGGGLGNPGMTISGTGFSSVDPKTGIETMLSASNGVFLATAAAIDPTSDTMYMEQVVDSQASLVAISTVTGKSSVLTSLTTPFQTFVFDVGSGQLFGLSGFTGGELGAPGPTVTGTGFSTLNLRSGAAVQVAANTNAFLATASTIDQTSHRMYVEEIISGKAYLIGFDTTTGVAGDAIPLTNAFQFFAFGGAPVADNQEAQTLPAKPVTIDLTKGHQGGAPTSAIPVGKPAHGTVTGFPGTTVTYTPAKDYVGAAPDFSYKLANASGSSNTATATVTVVPTLFSAKTKSICTSVAGTSGDVSAAFDGASIALEGGGAKEVAINTATSIFVDIYSQIASGDDEVFGNEIELSAGVAEFAKKAISHFTNVNPISIAMEADSLVFSGVSLLSNICANDPPDFHYKTVVAPSKLAITKTGNATVDKLQVDYLNFVSLTAATVHAAERWQGATLDNAASYATLQQKAFTSYSAQMMAAKDLLKADNAALAKALPSVDISTFPGGAKAMAAAFNAQCGQPLPSDLNAALLSLHVTQDQVNTMVCAYANSVTPEKITTNFKKALAAQIP